MSSRRLVLRAGMVLLFGLWATPGAAADKYWVGPPGGWWDMGTNWSTTPGGAGGAGQPQHDESAYVTANYPADYTVQYWNTAYPTAVHPYVVVDRTGAGSPTLVSIYDAPLTANMLSVAERESGKVIQALGTWTVNDVLSIGRETGSTGFYELHGGGLVSGLSTDDAVEVGYHGTGTFTHSGGTHTANAILWLGYYPDGVGTYIMNSDHGTPHLDSSKVHVGDQGLGLFQQYAGTHHATDGMQLASGAAPLTGTYELHGGDLQVDGSLTVAAGPSSEAYFMVIGTNPATATVGGDIAAGAPTGSSGFVVLQGGTLTVHGNITGGDGYGQLVIDAPGALDFQGSTIDVDEFMVGSSASTTGAHATSAGEAITCQNAHVGYNGTGHLAVSNGGSLHCTGEVIVGFAAGQSGTLAAYSGSPITTDGDAYVGYGGVGYLYLYYNSSVSVGDDLYVGSEAGSWGALDLFEGTLQVADQLCLGGTSVPGGAADMTIKTSAIADIGGVLRVHADAELVIEGGTLRIGKPSDLVVADGTILFKVGTVELTSLPAFDLDSDFLTTFLGPEHTLKDGQHLLCSAGGLVKLVDQLVIDGGEFSAAYLENAHALRFERGRFNKVGSDLLVGAIGTFGDLLTVREQQHYHAEGNVAVDYDGHLQMAGGRLSTYGGDVIVGGRISGDGIVEGYLEVLATGEAEVQQGQTLDFTSTANSLNVGQILLAGGTVRMAGSLNNQAGGNIMGRGTLISSLLDNDGDVALSNGITDVRGDVLNDTSGRIIISGQADVTFWDDVASSGALFHVSADSSATFFGEFTGPGGISGAGHVYLESDITPGSSPAAIGFGGDVRFGPLSRLNVELGGTAAGSGYDQVNVAGSASLDGTLAIALIDSFTPQVGDGFEIMTYASRAGEFADTTGWLFDGNKALVKVYGANALTLLATYRGDATLDFCVDGLDYVAWSNNYLTGDTWQEGDFNADGIADGLDYVVWSNNYLQGCPGRPGAVPEPTSALVLILGICALRRRRRGR